MKKTNFKINSRNNGCNLANIFFYSLLIFLSFQIFLYSAISPYTNTHRYDGPPITEMSDDLFEAIYNRARQLSYLEETEHTFNFQGCIRFKKNNIGSILNLASITRMTNILNRVYFITNQYTNEHGYSYPIIKLALRERRQNQTRSAHTFDSSWNTILGWAIGSRWPRENTPEHGWKYVVRYYFNNVPSSHKTRIKKLMEEWEEASDDEIWFKNMNDINQTCGIWPVTWQCNNDDKDWGKPRFRIERHSAATFAHVNRLGAGLGTSVLQYDPWDNDSLASVNETPYPEGSWSRNVVSSLTIYTSNYSSTAIIKYDGINSYFNTYSDNGPLLRTTHYVNNYRTINGIRFNQFNRTMRHELGHILGLIHEHQRDDRNNYIYRGVVPHDNSITGGGYSVTGGCSGENSSQFDIWPHGTDDLTTYDYDSVMHYWDDGRNCYSVFRKCNNSYANCPYGGYSIDARIIYRNTTAKLSPKDIQGIQELYD